MKGQVLARRNTIRVVDSKPPEPRICKNGCNPDPQPIEKFYRRTYFDGSMRWDYICKLCYLGKQKALRRDRVGPPKKRNIAAEPKKDPMLNDLDTVACKTCGLRGHTAGDGERCPALQERSTGLGGRGAEWTL